MFGTRIVGIAAGSLLTATLAFGAAPHASVRHTAAPAKTAKVATAKHVRHAGLHKSAKHAKLVKHGKLGASARHARLHKSARHAKVVSHAKHVNIAKTSVHKIS